MRDRLDLRLRKLAVALLVATAVTTHVQSSRFNRFNEGLPPSLERDAVAVLALGRAYDVGRELCAELGGPIAQEVKNAVAQWNKRNELFTQAAASAIDELGNRYLPSGGEEAKQAYLRRIVEPRARIARNRMMYTYMANWNVANESGCSSLAQALRADSADLANKPGVRRALLPYMQRKTGFALSIANTPNLSADQAAALAAAYPGFQILNSCSGRFSGIDRDELVLGIVAPRSSLDPKTTHAYRVGLIWNGTQWIVHHLDSEIDSDPEADPQRWQVESMGELDAFEPFKPNDAGLDGDLKCNLKWSMDRTPNAGFEIEDADIGEDKPWDIPGPYPRRTRQSGVASAVFFDLAEERLQNNQIVCFPTNTDDIFVGNWDCVVFVPKENRFRLWYQQQHWDPL